MEKSRMRMWRNITRFVASGLLEIPDSVVEGGLFFR